MYLDETAVLFVPRHALIKLFGFISPKNWQIFFVAFFFVIFDIFVVFLYICIFFYCFFFGFVCFLFFVCFCFVCFCFVFFWSRLTWEYLRQILYNHGKVHCVFIVHMFVGAKVHLSFCISNGILLLIVKSKTGRCCISFGIWHFPSKINTIDSGLCFIVLSITIFNKGQSLVRKCSVTTSKIFLLP